ncbi:ABC transporter ATP-binding protein [Streptomyces sp. NPDC046915]|uniref:ABC transporter ATP-binding protein n=1 Tax=Streptomyces sp. NPDC046915 TaxID=3155257 RepID=UPI0033EFC1D1
MTPDNRRGTVAMARLALRTDPVRTVGAVVMTLAISAHPVLVALLIGRLTDTVVAGDADAALAWGMALAGAVASWLALLWYTFGLRTVLEERVRHAVEMDIAAMSMAPWSVAHHEDPEIAEELALVERDVNRLAQVVIFLLTLMGALGQLLFAVFVLADVHPALLLLPVLGLVPVRAGRRGDRWRQASLERATPEDNLARELYSVLCDAGHAQELSVLGAQEPMLARHRRLSDAAQDERERGAHRSFRAQADATVLFAAAYVAAVSVAVLAAVAGHAGIGEVLLTATLAAQVTGQVTMATDAVTQLVRARATADRYLRIAELASSSSKGGRAPGESGGGLALRDVTFTYRGAVSPALRGIDLDVPGGRTIAVVGENGAGKTTLAKLLCRLYAPTGGSITWHGVDLAELDPDAWRDGVSAAYQDFVRFETEAGQTVGLGDLPRLDDADAVRGALARADGQGLEQALPAGLRTPLGRSHPDGTELSTGQWQKLAVARSMMRRTPHLLVLDEPTASLDAETEYRLFRHYAEAARSVTADGRGVVVVITHRLGSVRFADRIVVMDRGRIVESGSHPELMAAGGRYAELYRAQADAYATEATPAADQKETGDSGEHTPQPL